MIAVWWKRQGEWIKLITLATLSEAETYANMNITHGHITQRIEIRDGTGVLRTVYDENW